MRVSRSALRSAATSSLPAGSSSSLIRYHGATIKALRPSNRRLFKKSRVFTGNSVSRRIHEPNPSLFPGLARNICVHTEWKQIERIPPIKSFKHKAASLENFNHGLRVPVSNRNGSRLKTLQIFSTENALSRLAGIAMSPFTRERI